VILFFYCFNVAFVQINLFIKIAPNHANSKQKIQTFAARSIARDIVEDEYLAVHTTCLMLVNLHS